MRMSDEEIRNFLREPRIARFASNGADGYPHIIATWFIYDDGWIYFFCGRSAPRANEIQTDERVALLIDDDHYPYKHVTIYGSAYVDESITDEYLTKLCVKYLGSDWGVKYTQYMKDAIDPIIVKVKVSKMLSWDYHTGGYKTKAQRA